MSLQRDVEGQRFVMDLQISNHHFFFFQNLFPSRLHHSNIPVNMPQKGGSKKAPAAAKDGAAVSTPPLANALLLTNEPKVKKRECNFTDAEDLPGKK